MIAHLVLFTLKPEVTRDDPRLAEVVGMMAALPAKIPAIKSWEHGFNLTADAEAADYGLRALFDSEAALHGYFGHPAHLPVLDAWSEIATLSFADIET